MAISTAKVWVKVTSVSGSGTYELHLAKEDDANWGATLTGDATDMDSTRTKQGETKSVSSTGWVSFTFDATYATAETIWWRLNVTGEADKGSLRNITFASQDNATAGDRPYMEIIASSGAIKDIIGMGIIPFNR